MSFHMIDEKVEKSCWNITAWALTAFVVLLCVVTLMSGSGSEVAASAATTAS